MISTTIVAYITKEIVREKKKKEGNMA